MSDLNYIAVKSGISRYKKHWFLIVCTLYRIILTKNIVAKCAEFYYKRPNDWLAIFL